VKIAIHQPNFLPWIGYFHKISCVDKFVFFDDVVLSRGKSFTSRTKIIIAGHEKWMTIPIIDKSGNILIKDVKVCNGENWKNKHLKTLELNYRKTVGFEMFFEIIEKTYSKSSEFLIDYNIPLITGICEKLGIKTKFICSSELNSDEKSVGLQRIIEINKLLNADTYLSGAGKGSKRYIDENNFKDNKIGLEWQEYETTEYKQIGTESFVPNLSIIDLVFNEGTKSLSYIVQ
jgi:hypothetical protein